VREGLYESLLTEQLRRRLGARPDLTTADGVVDEARQPHVLATHLARVVQNTVSRTRGIERRVELVDRLLAVLAEYGADDDRLAVGDPAHVRQLLSLAATDPIAGVRAPRRPATPLAEAALLTNAKGEPTLAAELRAELESADGVDLLCAFITWNGVRLLGDQLADLRRRGVPLRVITTTYLGATEKKALDALVTEHGAEVKVSYEVERTRLHAKAWLLHRATGFATAYVGSSNLSHTALVDGLEWNVRLSTVATPALIGKFEATFDSYWSAREFEAYQPALDGDRLAAALEVAGGRRERGTVTVTLSGLEVRPKPHQAEILEELDAERTLHDRHRNLVVAATGTGKTVVAALDYRRLVRQTHGRDLSLLFVAHRKEILEQSRRMYQEVLSDAAFGELWVGGRTPDRGRHVFASVQSLAAAGITGIPKDRFDVVVIDEFHHAQAASYRRILDHVAPLELLGLTATPERGDGVDVRAFFDGRTAAELRLWDALDQNLLCPFHYFGIHDGTDLTALTWSRGTYDVAALDGLYTGNDARLRIVLHQVRAKTPDVGRMRALGFCVSTAHARYMAQRFAAAGIPSRAVWADTPQRERDEALSALRRREINVLFAVDLFNEGLDIPEIDTVLFLRPTESVTVFLQQLGRGLRPAHGKSVLTALDFVGHQRREFRFDQRFGALTGLPRRQLERQVDEGFPFLPSGCQIVLDPVARDVVLASIRQQVSPRWAALRDELRSFRGHRLAGFLEESGRDLADLVRSDGRSWTALCRDAGKTMPPAGPDEAALARRVRAIAHVDDATRLRVYRRLLSGPTGSTSSTGTIGDDGEVASAVERRLAAMLFFSLYPDGGTFTNPDAGLATLAAEPALRDEMVQVADLSFDRSRRPTVELAGLEPALRGVPLAVHASYSREEILAALDHATMKRRPNAMREGVAWCEAVRADAFLITLQKSERDFSPTTMYRDYALAPDLFHWESQSTTSVESPTGQRYLHHAERGTHILLFVRARAHGPLGTAPYVFLGPADYVSHAGDRPVAVTWRLRTSMPTEVFLAARAAAA
jgi:superfamily II DNA or RNA helicase/HKD family nuclease